MALGVPPYAASGTNGRRKTQAAPPIASPPNPEYAQGTTTTTTAPPPPPQTPPTGTVPNPLQPLVPNSPANPNQPYRPAAGPPGPNGQYPQPYQVPQIPYQDNKVILPSTWQSQYPGVPYPFDSVSSADAQNVLIDQTMLGSADTLSRQGAAANTLASQYDAWLRSTQARALGQLTGGIASASAINGLNNNALKQSAVNQLGLNWEQQVRNNIDRMQLGNANNLLNTNLGLAGQQRDADKNRIMGQWQLRNGQLVADQDYIRGVWGRTTEQYGADQAHSQELADQARLGYGYAANDLQNQTARTNLQESANRRAAQSDAAARGAFSSSGFRENLADIAELGQLGRESAWNQYEQQRDSVTGQLQNIDYGRGNLDRQYAGNIADYQKQLGDVGRNYQGDVLNYQYGLGQANRDYASTAAQINKQLADNRYADQALQSMARSLGIQSKDITQTLATATQRNNINLSQLIADMNSAYQQGDADRVQQFNQFLYQLIGA